MRMLIIEVYNVNRGNKDFLRIASQPFRGNDFYNGDNLFQASDGFILLSHGGPDIHPTGLYLRGRQTGLDNKILSAPNDKKWMDRLARAVREYNNYLEDTGGIRTAVSPRDIRRNTPDMDIIGLLTVVEESIR